MKQLYQELLRLMPYFFWALVAIVSMLMLIELAPKEDSIKNIDKIQHAIAFLILSTSGYLAFKNKMATISIGLMIFGAVIEVLQAMFTTTRTGDVKDWLADVLGILIGLAIILIYRQFAPKRLQ